MALLHLALGVATVWALIGPLSAREHAPSHAVEIRFVPASGSGTVSLGIYDASGKLVRVLCDEWTFNRFRVGLNGLATSWDGLDDAGLPVSDGTYRARGYVVDEIGIDGEAFHFNDWIDGVDSPRIVSVAGQQLLPDGDVLLVVKLAGGSGALVRYSPESEARWKVVVSSAQSERAAQVQLAVSDTMAFVLLDGKLRSLSLADGAETPLPISLDTVKAVAARGDRLAVLDDKALRFYRLPQFVSQGEASRLPEEFVSIALLDQGAVAVAKDGSVWRWQAGWSRLEMPSEVRVAGVSGGQADTFWVLEVRADGSTAVAHYSAEEGRLAEWVPRAEDGQLTAVAGAMNRDYFAATLDLPNAQRSVAIRRKADQSGWEFVYDKKISSSIQFGWLDGKLVPQSEDLPGELTVTLMENPLDPSVPRKLKLQAVANESGTGLATADGLPLIRVSAEPRFNRVMVVPGALPNTARFFQGDEACVEEYSLKKLQLMTSFDAGIIRMTGRGEATPPPPEEPEESDKN